MDYNKFLEKLISKVPFSMIRWGDGERLSLFGCNINHYSANKSLYYPEMGVALRKILEKPLTYLHGLQNMGYRMFKDKIDQLVDVSGWYHSDILHLASINGELERMFNVLKDNKVLLIGPDHLRNMDKYFKYDYFIQIDAHACWLDKDKIENKIREYLTDKDYTVVLVCAGQTANVIVDDMYPEYGLKHTFIDIGSLFEPYVGVSNREYHNEILQRLNKGQ